MDPHRGPYSDIDRNPNNPVETLKLVLAGPTAALSCWPQRLSKGAFASSIALIGAKEVFRYGYYKGKEGPRDCNGRSSSVVWVGCHRQHHHRHFQKKNEGGSDGT